MRQRTKIQELKKIKIRLMISKYKIGKVDNIYQFSIVLRLDSKKKATIAFSIGTPNLILGTLF
jgi:hypothetical protein